MSIRVSKLVARAHLRSASQKAIAAKLAEFAGDDGTNIFPSVSRLVKETQFSERTVQRALNALVKSKLLIVVEKGGRGQRKTTRYRFDLGVLEALAHSPSPTAKGDNISSKGVTMAPLGSAPRVTPCQGKGDIVASKGATVSAKGVTVTPELSRTTKDNSLEQSGCAGVVGIFDEIFFAKKIETATTRAELDQAWASIKGREVVIPPNAYWSLKQQANERRKQIFEEWHVQRHGTKPDRLSEVELERRYIEFKQAS